MTKQHAFLLGYLGKSAAASSFLMGYLEKSAGTKNIIKGGFKSSSKASKGVFKKAPKRPSNFQVNIPTSVKALAGVGAVGGGAALGINEAVKYRDKKDPLSANKNLSKEELNKKVSESTGTMSKKPVNK